MQKKTAASVSAEGTITNVHAPRQGNHQSILLHPGNTFVNSNGQHFMMVPVSAIPPAPMVLQPPNEINQRFSSGHNGGGINNHRQTRGRFGGHFRTGFTKQSCILMLPVWMLTL